MTILKPLIWLRNRASEKLAASYNNQLTDWEPPLPANIFVLADYCLRHLDWISDPLRGLLDHIQPIKYMNWQLENTGKLKGDCDDLATWTAYMLKRMGFLAVYRVNIIRYRHVICVFRYAKDEYKIFSNMHLYTGSSKSLKAAIDDWCDGNDESHTRMYVAENINWQKDWPPEVA